MHSAYLSYSWELSLEIIYDSIVKDHKTIHQTSESTGMTYSSIIRRIKYMKNNQYGRYKRIEECLIYNKTYRFKKRSLWEPFDQDLL